MKKALFVLILTILCFNAAPVRAQIAQCTGFKTTTLPLSGDFGGFGQFTVTRQTIPNPDANAPAPISVFIPSNATAQNKVPVVFFAHGFGGTSYQFYETLDASIGEQRLYRRFFALHAKFILDAHGSL